MNRTVKPTALLVGAALTLVLTLAWYAIGTVTVEADAGAQSTTSPAGQAPTLNSQPQADVDRKSAGCLSCHTPDAPSMHAEGVRAGCTDCHGGNASAMRDKALAKGSAQFRQIQDQAHVQPRLSLWRGSSANPENVWFQTLDESAEFIRFVNPGDLRVAELSCGPCHAEEVRNVGKSMMRHGGMLWGAALYNNGSFPFKDSQFGEFYTRDGQPAIAYTTPQPTDVTTQKTGVLPFLGPLFPFQVSQPGNLLRIFERGGRKPIEIGIPDPEEEPGRPKNRLSNRGLGTLNRTDPVFIGLQKTRLLDPTLNFIGSNDVAGDYRSGGCTACHVVYANDRSPVHSGQFAKAGHLGRSQSSDEMIPKEESGHPIKHVMTTSVPTSQCMTCHMHPGTNMLATYQGLTWWDNETDGDKMYPPAGRSLSNRERVEIEQRNPEGSALRGLWSDREFLHRTGSPEFNAQLKDTQFADFHGHGWLFRAVFKRDRKGALIDSLGKPVQDTSSKALADAVSYTDLRAAADRPATVAERAAERAGKPVHFKDIHLERGMQCVDCHFKQDNHGNGKLYGEPRNGVEIMCADCHGTARRRAYGDNAVQWTLTTSGPAAPEGGGTNLRGLTTPWGSPRFSLVRGRVLVQRSMTDENLQWEIPQVIDVDTPGSTSFNDKARLAHTMQRDGKSWGDGTNPNLAHADERMTCATCHSSWITSCFGCHLSQTANQKRQVLHNEIKNTRNWTQYNFQVLRDDVYMLGKDGTVAGSRISPVRSSSAVVVSSQDLNRQWIYYQQQTVSSEGYSGQAFNTHVPHTVRATETKTCTDCHVSATGDNNAVMSQLLLLGTNFVNFMGRFVYVATGEDGVTAIEVTEMEEPQAVIGSDLHRLAYPEAYAAHQKRGQKLTTSEHHASKNAQSLQARGEYLYIADGEGGFRVFDIAQINQKGFSEKIVSAPVSPFGQYTNVKTRHATAVAAPSTVAVDPARLRLPQNEEQPIALPYAFIYITDLEEGLVLSTAATLLDGNPSNNFLRRAGAFNPEGRLRGARNLAIAGNYAYIVCDRGLVIVNISDPLKPAIAAEVPGITKGTAVAVQFRYAFVTDAEGFKVVDITVPERARLVTGATQMLSDARNVYVARTYAYVAAGKGGLTIIDVERPEQPRIDQTFNADGAMNDTNDVKVAMTNASVFAYVADGKNGLRVLQIVSANSTPGAFGFSPRPQPRQIAYYKTHGPALAISKGLDRDRAVDESGNQVAVFGRRGGRPLNLQEMQRMYLRDGQVWTVSDTPPGPPVGGAALTYSSAPLLWPSHGRQR
ncbi:MAG: hypothetical protein ACT4QD_16050 [Acidobacteriota bacterium]